MKKKGHHSDCSQILLFFSKNAPRDITSLWFISGVLKKLTVQCFWWLSWTVSFFAFLTQPFLPFIFMPLDGLCHSLFGRGTDSIPHLWNVHILFLLWVENSHLDSKCLVFTATLTEFHLVFLLWIEMFLPNLALFTHLTAQIT